MSRYIGGGLRDHIESPGLSLWGGCLASRPILGRSPPKKPLQAPELVLDFST